jgi:DNA-binding FrmR family transcriptional regulator
VAVAARVGMAMGRRPSFVVVLAAIVRATSDWHGHPHETVVDIYTLGGYISPMRSEIKSGCLRRLSRIEGQVSGLARMIQDDRYCIDIVTQIAAVRTALRRVEEKILQDHVAHCVERAASTGDTADRRQKIQELMDVIGRADR